MTALQRLPLIAVLRGIPVDDTQNIGRVLVNVGFSCIEVPLNSPDPWQSISILAKNFSDHALIGAGTVLQVSDVKKVAEAGGKLIVMPHADISIVKEAKRLQLYCIPGFGTPTEAFAAIAAGADALKLFPAEAYSPAVLKAMKAVLPRQFPILPVGSITPEKMPGYRQVGAAGFGLGGALYQPNDSPEKVLKAAQSFVSMAKNLF